MVRVAASEMVGCYLESFGYTLDRSVGAKTRFRARRVFEEASLAKPNYKFQKRQKDLAKQKKKEEKRLKKAARAGEQPGDEAPQQ